MFDRMACKVCVDRDLLDKSMVNSLIVSPMLETFPNKNLQRQCECSLVAGSLQWRVVVCTHVWIPTHSTKFEILQHYTHKSSSAANQSTEAEP